MSKQAGASLCLALPESPEVRTPVNHMPAILVVEDDPPIRSMLVALLTEEHYRVLEASSARQALTVVAGERPDLFLFDYNLGVGMTGLELFDMLRAQGNSEDVPAIMTSAYLPPQSELDKRSIIGIGKPYSIYELLDQIEAVISTAHAYVA